MSRLSNSPEVEPIRLSGRAQGAMLAAASGDALGWPVEPRGNRVGGTRDIEPRLAFMDWTRREGGRYAPHERHIPAGTYSDDTQLMLAVGRSLGLGEEWWHHFTSIELPVWTLYDLGGGGAVKRAANCWAKGRAPWTQPGPADVRRYFDAGANGVVMRILPHAIHGAHDDSFDSLARRIAADGITTHGHPRALVGALAAGYAMWKAMRWQGKVGYGDLIDQCLDEREIWSELPDLASYAPDWLEQANQIMDLDYVEVWTHVVEEMIGLLNTCRDAIARGSLARDSQVLSALGAFERDGGSGTRTAAVAMYFASRYVARPSAGLLAAAFARKTDADTIACVTGALLGALSGRDWLDGLVRGLQDADYIRDLAERLALGDPIVVEEREWEPRQKRRILDRLSRLDVGGRLSMPLFKEGWVSRVERPETRSANTITVWWLDTAIGQRLAITKVSKEQPARAPGSPAKRIKTEGAATNQLPLSAPDQPAPVGPARALSFWTTLLVSDLDQAVSLYHGLLGLPVHRQGGDFVVFGSNLVAERARSRTPRSAPRNASSFDGNQIVGVLVSASVFSRVQQSIANAGFAVSKIERAPGGDSFRLLDLDGHLIEVRAEARAAK